MIFHIIFLQLKIVIKFWRVCIEKKIIFCGRQVLPWSLRTAFCSFVCGVRAGRLFWRSSSHRGVALNGITIFLTKNNIRVWMVQSILLFLNQQLPIQSYSSPWTDWHDFSDRYDCLGWVWWRGCSCQWLHLDDWVWSEQMLGCCRKSRCLGQGWWLGYRPR